MLFKIKLICDEREDFLREIMIDAESTFLDLNKAILESCDYPDDQMTSFFLCDEQWEQGTQITRQDMGLGSTDEDIYTMETTRMDELIEDEGQRLVFVFDPFNDRVFYMDVNDLIPGKNLDKPLCVIKEGDAPSQIIEIESTEFTSAKKKSQTASPILDDEEFYGTDDFNDEEFDAEGFEISDGDPYQ